MYLESEAETMQGNSWMVNLLTVFFQSSGRGLGVRGCVGEDDMNS